MEHIQTSEGENFNIKSKPVTKKEEAEFSAFIKELKAKEAAKKSKGSRRAS
jgi:hypothetical protein